MLCNVIHDINIQLSLNYVSRGKHTYSSIEGTYCPDMRLITCTSLINKLYAYLGPVCSFTLLYGGSYELKLPGCRTTKLRRVWTGTLPIYRGRLHYSSNK